ncbi:MAG: Flp pilus assembly protein CpaB [Rhodobacterales bacterium 12-64-8]|nr:MAG: Flp pilus assembly protein CpaB [Rhodobacterales bacterium 12-64-8]OYX50472.1 MAG: Flp pilus assembly protein CpaB [Alphaproteobacteria bacterium 32-64-14]
MSPVRLIILLVAAVAAIGAVFLVRTVQAPSAAAAAEIPVMAAPAPVEIPVKKVLVANNPIPIGRFVAAGDLAWQDWPADAPMDAFIVQEADAEALDKMVGAVARVELVKGEPVTISKLVHPGTAGFMSVMLTPGMRAVSFEIEPETAAGGFIVPNDRVDVIVTREVDTGGAKSASAMQGVRSDLILANVRVLAIDNIYGAPPAAEGEAAPRTGQAEVIMGSRATLELSDRDATLLNTAKKAGDLALVLRSVADLAQPQGATGTGRAYRDGVSQDAEGVRVYRYGTETVSTAPAG